MSEELNELQDTLQPDDTLESTETSTEPQVDVNKVLQENELLKQKNSQLFERTKKAEEKAKQAKPSPEVEFLETAKVAKKYSDRELEIIANYAKKVGVGISQAEKDEVVQLAIEAERNRVAKEQAIPTPSAANMSQSGVSYNEIASMDREKHMQLEKEMLAKRGKF